MALLKNSSIVITGVIISNILAYIFHFAAGRMLGPADYGSLGSLMAIFLIVALPAGAISTAITKYTSRYNANKEYGKIAYLRNALQNKILFLSIIILLLVIFFSSNMSKFLKIESSFPVIILGFTLIFALILPINQSILQGMKKFKVYSLNTIYESGIRLILLVILLFLGLGVNGAILAYGLAYLFAFIMIFPYIGEIKGNSLKVKFKPNDIDIKKIYSFIILVLSISLILQLLINAPTIFIKHYLSSEFTGYWTAALNIARISLFISGSIAIVMFPEVAGEKNYTNKKKIFKKALLLTLLASVGIALLFLIIGKLAILILYGSLFLQSLPLLKLMGIAMIPLSILQLWISYWLACYN